MSRTGMRSVLLCAAVSLTSCGRLDLAALATRPEAVEARQAVDTLASGDVEALAARLDESQRGPGVSESLGQLAALFPRRPPTRVRLVGYQANTVKVVGGLATETTSVTFESTYDNTYVLSNVVLRRVGDGPRMIFGLHAQPVPAPVEELNNFSVGDMGFVQYAFLLAMVAVAATIGKALVTWFRLRHLVARRWWWLLAILVGPFKFSVNWITGGVAVQALTIQFLGLSAEQAGLAGPWVLSFSIPAGAIAFLINTGRERKRAQHLPAPAVSDAPQADAPE